MITFLVDGIPTPLKNMSSSVGMMTFPTEWKKMFQTTNQFLSDCNRELARLIGLVEGKIATGKPLFFGGV